LSNHARGADVLSATDYIVGAFATYYLAYCISNEGIDGPWGVFSWLRGLWTDEHDWKARGVRCVVCVSCWSGLLVTIGLVLLGHVDPWNFPIVWLGLAGLSIVLARYWQR